MNKNINNRIRTIWREHFNKDCGVHYYNDKRVTGRRLKLTTFTTNDATILARCEQQTHRAITAIKALIADVPGYTAVRGAGFEVRIHIVE